METETNLFSLQPLAIFQPQFVRRGRRGWTETGGWTDGGCRPPPPRRLGGGKLEKDLEEGGGEEMGSRNQRSQKSFSRLLPRPARLNFFSAQEFSYYSEFQAAHIHAQCTVGDGCGRVRLKSSPNRVTQGEAGRRGGSPAAYRGGNFFSSTNRLRWRRD